MTLTTPTSVSDHRVNVGVPGSGWWECGLVLRTAWTGSTRRSGTFAKAYYEKDGLAGNVASCILEDERGDVVDGDQQWVNERTRIAAICTTRCCRVFTG
jgi:hypothetical protein